MSLGPCLPVCKVQVWPCAEPLINDSPGQMLSRCYDDVAYGCIGRVLLSSFAFRWYTG